MITGAATALLMVLFNEVDEEPDRVGTGTAALIGGAVGLVYGGAMGAIFPTERWRRVRME